MTPQIIIVLVLTFLIYVIGTLAYAARVVGVKTGRIAVAFAVFNILALISRTANSLQAPLLAKTIENNISAGTSEGLLYVFRWILFSTTIASIIGAFLMPTFIKLFTKAVESFSVYRSIPRLILHGFSKGGIEQFKKSISLPNKDNITQLKSIKHIPKKVIALNTLAFALSTVGVLASLYAGCLNPELRTTCSTLSSVVNGFSTILMFIFVDPFISMMTDDVIRGECSELVFNRSIIFILVGLIVGTVLAQFMLVPAAKLIIIIAKLL
jgi:hypothetical protein